MASNRQLYVEIIGDDRSLRNAYKRSGEASKKFDRETKQTFRGAAAGSGAFKALGRQVAFASGAFIGAAGFVSVVKSSVGAASDLNEAVSKTNVVFGKSAKEVEDWSKTLATSFGLAGGQALEIASSFGALFAPMGLIGEEAARQSEKLTQLGADLASFYNTDVTDALAAVQSGLVGQSRPLRRYGILLDAARVQQEALRETGKKHAADLTNQEKVLARINIIYHDSAQAQGDFARTSGGLANQQRILRANITNLQEQLGTALLPAILKITKRMNVWLGDTKNQAKLQADLTAAVDVATTSFGLLADAISGAASAYRDFRSAATHVPGGGSSLDEILKVLFVPGYGLKRVATLGGLRGGKSGVAPSDKSGQDTLDRVFGHAAGGAGSFDATVTAAIKTTRRRLGLHAQWVRSQTDLAKAETTSGDADNRRVLVQQKKIIAAALSATTNLKKRKVLYQELGQIQDAILKIDQDAADKVAAAKKKQHDKELAQQKKIREAIQSQSDKVNAEFKRMLDAQKAAAAKLKARLKAATDAVRQQIGDLFTGPILNPTDAANKGILGVTGTGAPTIGTFTRDVVAQTAGFIARNADLARLARAGAPGALLKQLRDSGDSALIHTLATGSKAAQARLFKAVNAQEKVIQQIAHADIQARTVVVHSGNVRHTSVTPQSQRRGRGAGIVQGGYLRGD